MWRPKTFYFSCPFCRKKVPYSEQRQHYQKGKCGEQYKIVLGKYRQTLMRG